MQPVLANLLLYESPATFPAADPQTGQMVDHFSNSRSGTRELGHLLHKPYPDTVQYRDGEHYPGPSHWWSCWADLPVLHLFSRRRESARGHNRCSAREIPEQPPPNSPP